MVWSDWSGSTAEWVQALATVIALVGLGVIWRQIALQRRALQVDVYERVMRLIDSREARTERMYVQEVMCATPNVFEIENWYPVAANTQSQLGRVRFQLWSLIKPEGKSAEDAAKNLHAASMTSRRFDRLGIMWRQGLIPDELILDFYVAPILRCWLGLCQFVELERGRRQQPGYMWEFENLAWQVWRVARFRDRGLDDLMKRLDDYWPMSEVGKAGHKRSRRIGGMRASVATVFRELQERASKW